MKSSKDTALKTALSCIKAKRKRFYREIWKHWGDRQLYTADIPIRADWLTCQLTAKNPNLGCEFLIIIKALHAIKYGGSNEFEVISGIHKEYWPRFIKYYLTPMVTHNGGNFPHLGKTATIKELIARGWIHTDDSNIYEKDKDNIKLYCHIAPLVWPESYKYHQDAIEMNSRVGIPGRTGTTVPNKK